MAVSRVLSLQKMFQLERMKHFGRAFQWAYKGHTITFPNNASKLLEKLPASPEDLGEAIRVIFVGPSESLVGAIARRAVLRNA